MRSLWLARIPIALVTFFNLQCALAFLIEPAAYAPGFELSGPVGEGMVRGVGILFLMWNIPYLVALSDPVRRRVSLLEAIAMQATGFIGEGILLQTLPGGHPAVQATVLRFLAFDGLGLLALLLAFWLSTRPSSVPIQGEAA